MRNVQLSRWDSLTARTVPISAVMLHTAVNTTDAYRFPLHLAPREAAVTNIHATKKSSHENANNDCSTPHSVYAHTQQQPTLLPRVRSTTSLHPGRMAKMGHMLLVIPAPEDSSLPARAFSAPCTRGTASAGTWSHARRRTPWRCSEASPGPPHQARERGCVHACTR